MHNYNYNLCYFCDTGSYKAGSECMWNDGAAERYRMAARVHVSIMEEAQHAAENLLTI